MEDAVIAKLSKLKINTSLEKIQDDENYLLFHLIRSGESKEILRKKLESFDKKWDDNNNREDLSNFEYTLAKDMLRISSWKIFEAVLYVYLEDFENAKKSIQELKSPQGFANLCFKKGFMDSKYHDGYDYLSNLTERYFKLKTKDGDDENFEYPSFSALPPKGQAVVLSVKMILVGMLHKDDTDTVKQIIQLDDQYWVWHYILCKRLRCTRRLDSYKGASNSGPSEGEKGAIITAFQLAPSEYIRNYCMASYCQCLAEIIKARFRTGHLTLTFGDNTFRNNEEIFQFILEQLKERGSNRNSDLDIKDKKTFGECLRIAEIFSSILPNPYKKDYLRLAEINFEDAIKIRQKSTKLYHQFAKLKMQQKKYPEAVDCLRLSVKYNRGNMPAWYLLVNALKQSRRLNELDEMIGQEINEETCTVMDRVKLTVLNGYIIFYQRSAENGLAMMTASADELGERTGWDVLKSYKTPRWLLNQPLSEFALERFWKFLQDRRDIRRLRPAEKKLADFVKNLLSH